MYFTIIDVMAKALHPKLSHCDTKKVKGIVRKGWQISETLSKPEEGFLFTVE